MNERDSRYGANKHTNDLIESNERLEAEISALRIELEATRATRAPSGDSRASEAFGYVHVIASVNRPNDPAYRFSHKSAISLDLSECSLVETVAVFRAAPLPASQAASDARELLPYQILEVVDTHFGHKLYEIHNSDWIAFANAILAKANGGA